MAKRPFTPQRLRKTLLTVLIFVILLGAAGLAYAFMHLRTFAIEVNHATIDAEASETRIEQLQALKSQLSRSQSLVDKANQLFVTPDQFQSRVVTDIRSYATASGVKVVSTDFGDQAAGVDPTATVKLESPVKYVDLITFLSLLESNVPKLQVTSLSVSRAETASADQVKVDAITIKAVQR